MIVGIGTDLVKIDRFESKTQKRPFLDKIFTSDEISYCESKNKGRLASYAARYAAKEALMKAIGTGYAKGISFTEINIYHNENGAPKIELFGVTKSYADELGVQNILLTISHEKEYAIAFVILESY